MRKPLRVKNPRGQVSSVQSVPAPIGGWNAKNPISDMPPGDAISLVNWFTTTVDCVIRGGNYQFSTVTGLVETLAVYNRANGTNALFAASSTDVYDVSSGGAGVAQSLTITSGRWQTINFGDGTNQYLIMVNGVDAPYYFDGTNWILITGVSSPSLSGPTLSKLVNVNEYQGRLFFLEKDSLSFWYLPANAAGGTLVEFDLSSFANLGGYLMWAATWTFDGGSGQDDHIVFMTSEGEAIIYRGTDPSTASTWAKIGTYFLGKPIGRRSYVQFAGDLIALTQNGAYPMSQALKYAQVDERVALTDKIEKAFNEAARSYQGNFGWDCTLIPLKSALMFNIPISEGGQHQQFVMNTISKSWCKFENWDGECFAVFNDELYFGKNGAVHKAWDGANDNGDNIIAVGKTAFNYFGTQSQQKKFNLFRPLLQTNGDISFLTGFDVDYSDNEITGIATYSTTGSSTWDVSKWDEGYWSSGLDIVRKWTSPAADVGYCVSGGLKIATNSVEVHWVACDYVFETGGVV